MPGNEILLGCAILLVDAAAVKTGNKAGQPFYRHHSRLAPPGEEVAHRNHEVAGEHRVAVHNVAQGSHQGGHVQLAMDPHPGSLVVYGVEGVQLVVEEQQLLAVAGQRARAPLLFPIEPAARRMTAIVYWKAARRPGGLFVCCLFCSTLCYQLVPESFPVASVENESCAGGVLQRMPEKGVTLAPQSFESEIDAARPFRLACGYHCCSRHLLSTPLEDGRAVTVAVG